MTLLLIIAFALASGILLGAWLRLPLDLEGWIFRLLLGVPACGVTALALGAYSLALAQTVMALGGVYGIVWMLWSRKATAPDKDAPAGSAREKPGIFVLVCAGLGTAAMALALVDALAPIYRTEPVSDLMAAALCHVRAGRIGALETTAQIPAPMMPYLLYATALYRSGELPVSLLGWCFGALACAAIYVLGRRWAGPVSGIAAAAIFAVAPVTLSQSGDVSRDMLLAALAAGALAAALAWAETPRLGWPALAGLLAGSACGVRHSGLLMLALAPLAVLALARERRWAGMGICLLAGLAAAMPWWIAGKLLYGDPITPYLSGWLIPGPGPRIFRTDPFSWFGLLRFPWDIVMRPRLFDGWANSPGGLVFILGIPCAFVGGRRGWVLGGWALAGHVAAYCFLPTARILLPFFVPLFALAGGACVLPNTPRKTAMTLTLLMLISGLLYEMPRIPRDMEVVFGVRTKTDLFAASIDDYPAIAFANDRLNDGKTLLTLDPRAYLYTPPVYANAVAIGTLDRMTPAQQTEWFTARKIGYIMVLGAVQNAHAPNQARAAALLERWRRDPERFRLIKRATMARLHEEGHDWVEFYEVINANTPASKPPVERDATP